MSPGWWGVVAVVVLGIGAVWVAGWRDRRTAQRASQIAHAPVRTLPGLAGQEARPAYLTDAEIAALPIDGALGPSDADVLARRDAAPSLPAGVIDASFLNLADRGLAVVADPSVVVLGCALEDDRDVTTLLLSAGRRGRPLVVVAPDFSVSAIATLRANTRTGRLRCLPIPLADAGQRRRAVALTGGRLVNATDLAAGWLPDRGWGACAGWISDLDDSWVILDPSTSRDSQSDLES